VITGKTRLDTGRSFFGQTIDLARLSEAEIAHAGIGRKFQKPTIFERHTAFENLELAMKADKRVRRTLFAKLSREEGDRIAAVLDRIRLAASADRHAGLLSHGQKQWLEIGMLLMQEPRLLLLDEPVAGMSDEETERTAELFLSLAGEHSLVGGGQDHAPAHVDGPRAGEDRLPALRRTRPHARPPRRARPCRHRLRAARARDLPAAHGGGEPRDGPRHARARRRASGAHLRDVPGA